MQTKVLTIIFADMVGSTDIGAGLRRGENVALSYAVRNIYEPIISEYGGRVVKRMGDGFMAVFDSPTNAVLAGRKFQDTISGFKFSGQNISLAFRVGINTGEVGVDDQDDIFGEAVNLAARIESVGKPGAVYLSVATYHAMNKAEIDAQEVGKFKLKGIKDKIAVYKLTGLEHLEAKCIKNNKKSVGTIVRANKMPLIVTAVIIVIAVIAALLITQVDWEAADDETAAIAEVDTDDNEGVVMERLDAGDEITSMHQGKWYRYILEDMEIMEENRNDFYARVGSRLYGPVGYVRDSNDKVLGILVGQEPSFLNAGIHADEVVIGTSTSVSAETLRASPREGHLMYVVETGPASSNPRLRITGRLVEVQECFGGRIVGSHWTLR